jgi:hypothetical protein
MTVFPSVYLPASLRGPLVVLDPTGRAVELEPGEDGALLDIVGACDALLAVTRDGTPVPPAGCALADHLGGVLVGSHPVDLACVAGAREELGRDGLALFVGVGLGHWCGALADIALLALIGLKAPRCRLQIDLDRRLTQALAAA